jgi:cobalt-zinc-cadmium efflux system outer membrane protein
MSVRVTPIALAVVLGLLARQGAAQEQALPTPLSLEEAVRLASDRSPRLAGARATVAVAVADRLDASLRPNPALSAESANYPLFGAPRPSFWSGQEFSVRIDQEFETAGRRRLRTDAAAARVEVAEAELANARRLLEFDVRRGYFDVVLAVADLETSARSLSEIDQLIALNRARFQQGEISGVEVRRLQVERLRFSDDASAAELALRRTRSALLALLAYRELGQPFEVTASLTPPSANTTTLAASGQADLNVSALQTRALAARHDVRAIRAEEARTVTLTRLQRALRTPNITAGGGYTRDFGTKAVAFGFTVPLPLTNRNQGGIARAEAERQIVASQRDIIETLVRLEVQQAADAVEIARSRATAIERDYLPAARQALDTVLASYRAGATNLIDFLDAQRAFRDTQRTYNRALFDWQVSLAQLGAAVGDSPSSR